jgi:hypothetical protein
MIEAGIEMIYGRLKKSKEHMKYIMWNMEDRERMTSIEV